MHSRKAYWYRPETNALRENAPRWAHLRLHAARFEILPVFLRERFIVVLSLLPTGIASPHLQKCIITSCKPAHKAADTTSIHEIRAHFLVHALTRSPTKGLYEYTKRKCAQLGASLLTCRSYSEMFGRISSERRVALMLH